MRRGRRYVLGLVGVLGVAAAAPFATTAALDGWGTVGTERRALLPGDDALVSPQVNLTQAVAIRAPPEQVWPWLVQMGQDRGGFYSYAWLENLFGCDVENADRIEPQWQALAVGDPIRLHPRLPHPPRVAGLDPPRDLLLAVGGGWQRPGATWLFHLAPQADGSTRLIARVRVQHPDFFEQWLAWDVVTAPATLVMQRKMLLGIRDRAEGRGAAPLGPKLPGGPSSQPTLTLQEGPWPRPGT